MQINNNWKVKIKNNSFFYAQRMRNQSIIFTFEPNYCLQHDLFLFGFLVLGFAGKMSNAFNTDVATFLRSVSSFFYSNTLDFAIFDSILLKYYILSSNSFPCLSFYCTLYLIFDSSQFHCWIYLLIICIHVANIFSYLLATNWAKCHNRHWFYTVLL